MRSFTIIFIIALSLFSVLSTMNKMIYMKDIEVVQELYLANNVQGVLNSYSEVSEDSLH